MTPTTLGLPHFRPNPTFLLRQVEPRKIAQDILHCSPVPCLWLVQPQPGWDFRPKSTRGTWGKPQVVCIYQWKHFWDSISAATPGYYEKPTRCRLPHWQRRRPQVETRNKLGMPRRPFGNRSRFPGKWLKLEHILFRTNPGKKTPKRLGSFDSSLRQPVACLHFEPGAHTWGSGW